MLLYLIFGPLLLFIIFSRINGARKLLLTFLLFIGGYGYIMLREATKYQGERKRKREFLERVAPKQGGGRQGSGAGRQTSNGYGHSNGSNGYGGTPRKQASYTPTPSERGESRGKQL